MAAESRARQRPELWVIAAWVLLATELAAAIYLGLRRPGGGPARAYLLGAVLLPVGAFLLGLFGAVWSIWRRPFARPERIVAFCLLALVVTTASYPLPFPSYRASRPSSVELRLPFEGEWTVAWGGADDTSNYLLRTRPDRRFAYVFVVVRDAATRARPAEPRSAFAFDAAVLAPCDGAVVAARDDLPDDGAGGGDDLGNHVVIEIAAGEYLFLCNLKQSSLTARAGERVTAGQVLARVGWSARTPLVPEPHLAVHLQDTPVPLWGQAIPFTFRGYRSGDAQVERGSPRGRGFFVGRPLDGERVQHAAP